MSAGLRPLWLLKLFHHDDLRLADIVVPLSSSSRDIVSAGLRPLCLKSHVPERVLASNPAMNNVCIGSDSRNTHTHTLSSRGIASAGLRLLWLLEYHHDDLRLADVVVPLSSSSRDICNECVRISSDSKNTQRHLSSKQD